MKTSKSKYCRCLYFVSNALARKVEKIAAKSWKKVDLSPSHAYLLLLVIQEPGMQPSALSEQLDLTPSTITRLIEKLEEKKLVARNTEGKITMVNPTTKAKNLYPKMLECLEDFTARYGAVIDREESERLVQAINKVSDKLGG